MSGLSPAQGIYPHHLLAPTPPLGWNSYDCYGSSVTEQQMQANVDAFVTRLAPAGYRYVVLDYCWSVPAPRIDQMNPNQDAQFQPWLTMDEFGRLLPAPERFPSAASGQGLRPLADYVHQHGLKFGLHIMRGIPRQAVQRRTPVKGTGYTAADVAMPEAYSNWLNHMYGVNVQHPAGQAYYNSLFELYAQWGVDYIKADDMLAGHPAGYCGDEIAAVRKAIDACGRPMVLSLSPGRAPLGQTSHLLAHANLWRMSGDMWDQWPQVKGTFAFCEVWQLHAGPGHWPDADMLPLGRLCVHGPEPVPHDCRLSTDERRTLLTLWSIVRSPLIMGGELAQTDDQTIADITNRELLQVNQQGTDPRQVFHFGDRVCWRSARPDGGINVALFNIGEHAQMVEATWLQLAVSGRWQVRDLWAGADAELADRSIQRTLPPHACALLALRPG